HNPPPRRAANHWRGARFPSRSLRFALLPASPLFSSFNSFIGYLSQKPISDMKDCVGDVAKRCDIGSFPADVHARMACVEEVFRPSPRLVRRAVLIGPIPNKLGVAQHPEP